MENEKKKRRKPGKRLDKTRYQNIKQILSHEEEKLEKEKKNKNVEKTDQIDQDTGVQYKFSAVTRRSISWRRKRRKGRMKTVVQRHNQEGAAFPTGEQKLTRGWKGLRRSSGILQGITTGRGFNITREGSRGREAKQSSLKIQMKFSILSNETMIQKKAMIRSRESRGIVTPQGILHLPRGL